MSLLRVLCHSILLTIRVRRVGLLIVVIVRSTGCYAFRPLVVIGVSRLRLVRGENGSSSIPSSSTEGLEEAKVKDEAETNDKDGLQATT